MLTQNSKLKKTSKLHNCKILGFNLPPVTTCPYAGECRKYCYAVKAMARCRKQMQANLDASKRTDFVTTLAKEILEKKPTHIRIHPSGDFYSKEYFIKWIKIARLFPEVIFYGYTKSIPIVCKTTLPKNMVLMYSYGGKADNMGSKSIDKHCIVIDSILEVPNNYVIGNEDDLLMLEHHAIAFLKH